MMKATKVNSMPQTVRDQACCAADFDSFAELTAVTVADRFVRIGRRSDALRILHCYLQRHPTTSKVEQRLAALSA